jgi:hypothetical protein
VAVAIPPRCAALRARAARSRETARAERVRGAGASVAVVAQWGELERADGGSGHGSVCMGRQRVRAGSDSDMGRGGTRGRGGDLVTCRRATLCLVDQERCAALVPAVGGAQHRHSSNKRVTGSCGAAQRRAWLSLRSPAGTRPAGGGEK